MLSLTPYFCCGEISLLFLKIKSLMLTPVKIIKSKLWSNIWNQFLLYGFSSLVPFFLIPFLLSHIGVEKYGLINFALAFTFYFQVINEFGFDLSNVRHVVDNRNSPNELGKVFSSILACKGLLVLLSLCVYIPIIYLVPYFHSEIILYVLAFIRLLGIVITPYWLFRSLEDVKYITRISILVKVICVFPIFITVKEPDDYIKVMFFFALETFVSGVLALYVGVKRYSLILSTVSFSDIKYFFKDSLPFFSSTFLLRITTNSNAVLLGFFSGDYAVGLYTAAEKLHNVYASLVSPLLSHIFYPYFTRIKGNITLISKIVKLICISNLILLLFIYLLSPYLIPLYIKTDVETIMVYYNIFLLLLCISIPTEIVGFPCLGVLGKIKEVSYTTILSSFCYLIGTCILVIFDWIKVSSVIWILVISQIICFIARLYFIISAKPYKTNISKR